jgi:hypothetical protein
VQDDLDDVLGSREGHYVFESGLHGRLWLDLEQLFSRPGRIVPLAAQLAARLAADPAIDRVLALDFVSPCPELSRRLGRAEFVAVDLRNPLIAR